MCWCVISAIHFHITPAQHILSYNVNFFWYKKIKKLKYFIYKNTYENIYFVYIITKFVHKIYVRIVINKKYTPHMKKYFLYIYRYTRALICLKKDCSVYISQNMYNNYKYVRIKIYAYIYYICAHYLYIIYIITQTYIIILKGKRDVAFLFKKLSVLLCIVLQ